MKSHFKLALAFHSVIVEDSDGKQQEYRLVEMIASARDQYMDSLRGRLKTDDAGKVTGVVKFEGMQADLLSRCFFDPSGKLVTKEVIQSWPASVVSELFEAAQKMNHLNKQDDAAVSEIKND